MNLLKYQRGYLGDASTTLDNRITDRCGGGFPSFLEVGEESLITGPAGDTLTGLVEPRVTRVSDTKALVMYRKTSNTTLYCNVITLDGVEITNIGNAQVVDTGETYAGHGMVTLEDNKVLCTYLATGNTAVSRVLNISGDTVTPTAETTLNTVAAYGAYTNPARLSLVSSGKVLLSFANTDSAKFTCQILDIDGSDVVTPGTETKSTDVSLSYVNHALLSSTDIMVMGKNATRIILEMATISGSSITFNGTSYIFPTTTQIPAPTGYTANAASIVRTSGVTAVVSMLLTTSSPTFSSIVALFTASNSGGTITSTTIQQETAESGTVPMVINMSGFPTTLYRKPGSGSTQTLRMLQHRINSSPPTLRASQDLLVAPSGVAAPEHGLVLDPLALSVYEKTDTTIGMVPYKSS